jgi:hypothetical protein
LLSDYLFFAKVQKRAFKAKFGGKYFKFVYLPYERRRSAIGANKGNSYNSRGKAQIGEKDLACADFQKAEACGYSKSYGDEVLKLLAEHCR